MATSQMSDVIQHLRRAVLLRDGAGMTDGQLLEDYISRRDEAALAALVRRHGPMVWSVCRRVLRNYHDAEDAFQATFHVLVRKAASIASRELLANWLYGVAHQTALKARATAAKRRTRERQVTEMPEPAAAEQDLWCVLQPLLDEELSRLPDRYRVVIVLCDLEGKTRKETARQLGVPEGTVAGRLARARTMLAKRLARHGLVVSGGALGAVLAQNAASACVPTSVVSGTIKAATLFAAGQAAKGVIGAKVAALTEGVTKAMFLTKLKCVIVALLIVAVTGAGIGSYWYRVQGAEPVGASKEAPTQADNEKSDGAVALNSARLAAARKAYESIWDQYLQGRREEEDVYRWSLRVLESQRALAKTPAEHVAAFKTHLDRMKELEKQAPERLIATDLTLERVKEGKKLQLVFPKDEKGVTVVTAPLRPAGATEVTAFYRAEAEVWLAKGQIEGR